MNTRHARLGTILGVSTALVVGCQTYAPKPLELSAHREELLARTPLSAEIAAFAAQVSSSTAPDAHAYDPSDGLSLGEAECIALVFNRTLRLERLRAGVTLATAETAGLWEDPILGVDLTKLLDPSGAWETFASVAFTLPLSGRLEIEMAQADLAHQAQLVRVAQQEWKVRHALRAVWTERAAIAAELEATREFVVRLDDILRIVDSMELVGELSRTQARIFRLERATQRAAQIATEAQLVQAENSIREIMGISPRAELALTDDSLSSALARVDSGALSTPAADRAAALAQTNLELRALAIEYGVSERALELEVRKQFPDLTVGPGYGKQDGAQQFVLGLSAPLALLNGNRAAIARARAEREFARAQAEVALEETMTAIQSADATLRAATARRASLETELVPLVEAQYADARAVAAQGEVDALLLLESLVRQHEAKVLLIDARRGEVLAQLRINELHGPAVNELHESDSGEAKP